MPSDRFQQQIMSNAASEIPNGNVKQFPDIGEDETADANPAIRLFGRRFRDDQTALEYLVEFMLVFVSAKTIGAAHVDGHKNRDAWKGFPPIDELQKWSAGETLIYYPKMHLMVKLFAFLGASSVEGRHKSHLEKHKELVSNLKHHLHAKPSISKNEVVELMEQVLMGFIGVSGNRGWSAHSFLPLAPELIAGEAIWEKSRGRREPNLNWNQVLKKNMFSFSKHDFLARGGEVLYLQLCNLFRLTDSTDLREFENRAGYPGVAKNLQNEIETNLKDFLSRKPAPILNNIASWIENNEEVRIHLPLEKRGGNKRYFEDNISRV
jgi:hypothetical protein